jgi:hypothetical protein
VVGSRRMRATGVSEYLHCSCNLEMNASVMRWDKFSGRCSIVDLALF